MQTIRPGTQTVQKPGVGPQRVVINHQQVVRPQNNTVRYDWRSWEGFKEGFVEGYARSSEGDISLNL